MSAPANTMDLDLYMYHMDNYISKRINGMMFDCVLVESKRPLTNAISNGSVLYFNKTFIVRETATIYRERVMCKQYSHQIKTNTLDTNKMSKV